MNTQEILNVIKFFPTKQLQKHYKNKLKSIVKNIKNHNKHKPKINGFHPVFFEAEKELNDIKQELLQCLGDKILIQPFDSSAPVFEEFIKKVALEHVKALNQYKKPIPKKLHFVWIGGSLPKANEIFLDIWLETMEPDWQKTLWVDSQKLLLNYVKKSILDVCEKEFSHERINLLGKYRNKKEEKIGADILYLKNKKIVSYKILLHTFINKKRKAGVPEEEIYIDFLTTQMKQERNVVLNVLAQQKQALEVLRSKPFLQIREISELMSTSPTQALKSIYDAETSLRINLAAASDIVRYQVLDREGGAYYDLDTLPPLHSKAKKFLYSLKNMREFEFIAYYFHFRYPRYFNTRNANALHPKIIKTLKTFNQFFSPIPLIQAVKGHLVLGDMSGNSVLYAHPGALSNAIVPQKSLSLFEMIARNYSSIFTGSSFRDSSSIEFSDAFEQLFFMLDFKNSAIFNQIRQLSLSNPFKMYLLDSILPGSMSTIHFTGPQLLQNHRLHTFSCITQPNQDNISELILALDAPDQKHVNHAYTDNRYISLYYNKYEDLASSGILSSTWVLTKNVEQIIENSISGYLDKINESSFYKHNIQLVFLDDEKKEKLYLSSARLKNKHPASSRRLFVKHNKIYRNIQATEELDEAIKLNPFTRLQLLGYAKKHHDFNFGNHTSEEIAGLLSHYLKQDTILMGNIRFLPLSFNDDAIEENDFSDFVSNISVHLQRNYKSGTIRINVHPIDITDEGRKINSTNNKPFYKNIVLFDAFGIDSKLYVMSDLAKKNRKIMRSAIARKKYQEFEERQLALKKKDTSTASGATRRHSDTSLIPSLMENIETLQQKNSVSTSQLHKSVQVVSRHLSRPQQTLKRSKSVHF